MSKAFNGRSLLSVGVVIALVAVLFLLLRSFGRQRTVNATISSAEIVLGEWIEFADSTAKAKSWRWDFGNGDYSQERSGKYTFPEVGKYQVRLVVDDQIEKFFIVRVRPYSPDQGWDHLIRIVAPRTAVQGEYILFAAEGQGKEWRWEFGESGIVDARDKTALYAYRNHGTYLVKLTTESTQYPIIHQIEILPKYMESDSLDVMTLAGADIKTRLQNIADGKPFNSNYNHILNTYLCGNPDVLVTVNNSKRNDFYSYCQGLRLTGRGKTLIEAVFVEANNPAVSCIDHIMVLQNDRRSDKTK